MSHQLPGLLVSSAQLAPSTSVRLVPAPRRAPCLDVGSEGSEHFLSSEVGATHNQAMPVPWERNERIKYRKDRGAQAEGALAARRPLPPDSHVNPPKSTSTQGSEPSCLTSAITEQLRLVERTFSLLTAWRKVLRWESSVSAGPR